MSSQFLINEPSLQVLPTLAREIGLNEAIVLQQIHYWLNLQFSRHFFGDRYWVRYTSKQWERQFSFWDKKTFRRALNRLERLGLVIAEVHGLKKARFYRIDYPTLGQITPYSGTQPTSSLSAFANGHANFDAINFVNMGGGD